MCDSEVMAYYLHTAETAVQRMLAGISSVNTCAAAIKDVMLRCA